VGVELGELIGGLRSNDAEVVDALRRVLAPIRVDDLAVFPNLSLSVGEGKGKTRELHRLYRRGFIVLRTPSIGRLVRSALKHLDSFLPPPPGLVPLGDLVVGDRGAVLGIAPFGRFDLPERRIQRMGWRGTDGAAAFLDPVTLEVVVTEPRLTLDPAALANLDERWPAREGEEAVQAGRYPIQSVVLVDTRDDDLLFTSPSRRRAGLASVLDTSVVAVRAADVGALGMLEGRVDIRRVVGSEPSELLDVLRDLSA
jgi:hypothetical protein